ncbi:hypothetical protein Hjap01_03253 [Haloarcula japonica]
MQPYYPVLSHEFWHAVALCLLDINDFLVAWF